VRACVRACVRVSVRPSVCLSGLSVEPYEPFRIWTWVVAKNRVLCGGLGPLVVAGSVAEWLACWTHVQ